MHFRNSPLFTLSWTKLINSTFQNFPNQDFDSADHTLNLQKSSLHKASPSLAFSQDCQLIKCRMAQILNSCKFALPLDSWLFDISGTRTISINPNIHFFLLLSTSPKALITRYCHCCHILPYRQKISHLEIFTFRAIRGYGFKNTVELK